MLRHQLWVSFATVKKVRVVCESWQYDGYVVGEEHSWNIHGVDREKGGIVA